MKLYQKFFLLLNIALLIVPPLKGGKNKKLKNSSPKNVFHQINQEQKLLEEHQERTEKLCHALNKKNGEKINLLVETYNEHTMFDKKGYTPLHYACLHGNLEATKLLIARFPALINTKALHSNVTPLHLAATLSNSKLAEFLINKKADLEAKTRKGHTPFFCAILAENLDTATLLLKHGADINATDTWGQTPLFFACSSVHPQTAWFLIENKIDLKAQDHQGNNALIAAAQEGNSHLTRLLLNKKIKVDCTNHHLRTPLLYAIVDGNTDVIKLLLKFKANIHHEDITGLTPLKWTQDNKITLLKDLLIDYNHDLIYPKTKKLLLEAAEEPGEKETLKRIIPDNLFALFCWAINNKHNFLVKHIMNNDPGIIEQEDSYKCPLICALWANNIDILSKLLSKGANPNAVTKQGFTPLHFCVQEGNHQATKLLLKYRAHVNALTTAYISPLHIAVYNQNHECINPHSRDLLSNSINFANSLSH